MQRNKRFCWYSVFLIASLVVILNLYYFKAINSPSEEEELEMGLSKSNFFEDQQSAGDPLYKIWPVFTKKKEKGSRTTIDLTIVSQTSVNNLLYVHQLVKSWNGPISISVFAPGEDIDAAVETINIMRNCDHAVKKNVTFTLVLSLSHPPMHTNLSFYLSKAKSHPYLCQSVLQEDTKTEAKRKNYGSKNLPYPVNLLRNVAIANAGTSYILVIDIDMSPSANLREKFQEAYPRIQKPNAAFVIPTFEVRDGIKNPTTKKELIELWNRGDARPFYGKVCWKCQKYTKYGTWVKLSSNVPSNGLSIGYKVKWQDPWEPFFIAIRNAVTYDERFKQYGFNRISQVCEMHISGQNFYVLDNAFLLHSGFKEMGNFHKSKEEENSLNRILFRQFKKDLKQKYPISTRRC